MCSTGMQIEPPIPTAASLSSAPQWTELPQDLTANILQRLHPEEILMSAQLVCTTWWRVSKDPSMWRAIHLDIRRRDFWNICRCESDNLYPCSCYTCCCPVHARDTIPRCRVNTCDIICSCAVNQFDRIFRCAVDRSQGQLIDLTLAGSHLDPLLNYVAHRSSQLRCLKLVEYLYNYGGGGSTPLILQITKLQQLEELQLVMKPWVDPRDFETIGIACPMLKSFTYHNCETRGPDFIEYAAAIGKTMPNLHHLRLCQFMTGNKVLEPILDGCPNLKSLDLRRCSGFDDKSSGKRCWEKDLWLYSDSISFVDWVKKWQDTYDSDAPYPPGCMNAGAFCDVFDWNYFYCAFY
ncbi:putative F-box/LRR-repeat protein 9 [Salvia hispanica]|uniref:putative F-box/LRR-repeat protein 9 n=1 Tax=Salvia hispanica TaxID=49212 RepID=UPI00200974B3|nr:putative F-box/LRR-repeat protein 9 [Salvia hispanica]